MTPPPTRRLVVITAGLSQPSTTRMLADRVSAAVSRGVAERGLTTEVMTVDLRDHAHDITDHLLRGFSSSVLDSIVQALTTADGAIAVTPIFATSYNGLFKSFLDILDPHALTGLPVLLAATGGTHRHSLALDYAVRPVFLHLHADPVPTTVYAATADWGTLDHDVAPLSARIDRAAAELSLEMSRPDRTEIPRAPDPLALTDELDVAGGFTAPLPADKPRTP